MTYEYECKCGHKFERYQVPMSESQKPAECPKCGEKAKRVLSETQKVPSWSHW